MNAAVDIGNTKCKIGFFENDALVSVAKDVDVEEAAAELIGEKITHVILSSVGKETEALAGQLESHMKVTVLSADMPLPVKLNYRTPETLGADRIAGAAGAFHLNPHKNSLVIDIGTCIKYDVVSREGVYEGGAISPGVEMRLKAMHHFTARLPLIEQPEWGEIPGKTTKTSMMNGVLYGTMAEIEGMIRHFSSIFTDLHVIICGGGSKFFESNIKPPIFACSDLVLIGLNSILLHNERN